MSNEIAVVEDKVLNIANDMSEESSQYYCSVKPDSDKGKAAVYKAMNNPDFKIADFINKKILVRDLYVETVELANEETGELHTCPHIVLFDMEGKTYTATSEGIYSAVKRVIRVFGAPTWEKGIPVTVKRLTTKANRQVFTLDIEF